MRMRLPRIVSVLLVLAFFLSGIPAFAASFSDVSSKTSYAAAIESLRTTGILKGYANGTFKPGQTINRAEFLKIALEARGNVDTPVDLDCFPDVAAKHWFARYVCAAKAGGIVAGYPNGKFSPENPISFAEAAKIVSLTYKQEVQEQGGEWYNKYVRSLESSKAIPPTIIALDRPITRGEMAEIMWRISEGKTDQPSKSYMNVKYPAMTVNLSSDAVQTAKSCADLEAFAKEAAAGGFPQTGGGERGGMMEDTMGAPTMAAPASDSAKSAIDYSGTNVQVAGVDEGDIVKTDGKELYIISNQKVRLVRAIPATSLREDATIDFSDKNFSPSDLYIDGSTLAIIGSNWNYQRPMPMDMGVRPGESKFMVSPVYVGVQRTEVRLYDVSDPTKPRAIRTVAFDGSQVSTRLIGSKLYLVTEQHPYWNGPIPLTAENLLPQMRDSNVGKDVPVVRCGDVSILPHTPSPSYLTIAVIPTNTASGDIKREVILGNGQNVFASLQNLYVAATNWSYGWDPNRPASRETTTVFRFSIDPDGVTFKSKGDVPGRLLNQFSMDEHEASFRVATTIGQSWDDKHPSTNNLYVLNMNLETVGSVTDIAPGEQIYSTRFLGDRAYMVTFKQIDPLFVIDTSNPRSPKILGRLKIPGYSNYLHPYDENHIIGFGKEVEESSVQGMKLALFDVTDVNDPKEMFKETIGVRGTDSPLLYNHKALLFDKERGLLSFPVSVYKFSGDPLKQGDQPAALPVFQGAYVYSLSLSGGFFHRGMITHYDPTDTSSPGFYYGGGKDIQRVVRIGESLYTISNAQVRSNALGTLAAQGKVEFGGEQPPVEVIR